MCTLPWWAWPFVLVELLAVFAIIGLLVQRGIERRNFNKWIATGDVYDKNL
jgi:hypothetical protein